MWLILSVFAYTYFHTQASKHTRQFGNMPKREPSRRLRCSDIICTVCMHGYIHRYVYQGRHIQENHRLKQHPVYRWSLSLLHNNPATPDWQQSYWTSFSCWLHHRIVPHQTASKAKPEARSGSGQGRLCCDRARKLSRSFGWVCIYRSYAHATMTVTQLLNVWS